MDLPTFISGTNSFPISWVLGGIFHVSLSFNRTFCNQIMETPNRASGMSLHCSPMLMIHTPDFVSIAIIF